MGKRIIQFLKKLCRNLWQIILFLWRTFTDFSAYADIYRGCVWFIKNMLKDIKPAYKHTKQKIFNELEVAESPLENKRGFLAAAGDNAWQQNFIRAFAGAFFVGIAGGAALSYYIPLWFIVILISLMIPILFYQMTNYRHGYFGECVVGEAINKIGQQKYWRNYHSVFLGEEKEGDIDHIIVCLKGVFCLETKTWRRYKAQGKVIQLQQGAIKIKNRKNDYNTVQQAKRNALRLHQFLVKSIESVESENSEKIPFITPIIVFPYWSVEENNDDEDLYIRNHERIGNLLERMPKNKDRAISEDMFKKICNAIEEKHRSTLSDLS